MKRASLFRFTLHPNLSSVSLHQPFCNCQSQAHAGCIPIYSHKILEYLLMVLWGYAGAGISDTHFNAIWSWQPEASPLLCGSNLRNSSFPKMRFGYERYSAAGRCMLQGVVQQIRRRLLNLLVVKFECRNRWIETHIKPDAFPLKGFRPSLRHFVQAVTKIILAQLQDQFSALEGRIVQKHRDEPHQALAAFLRFLKNILLFVG